MPTDLEGSLVEGGISPAAAKVIANAIANVASSQLSLGRRFGDATPTAQLRMIDGDTRRYLLPNLDHNARTSAAPPTRDRWAPRDTAHPYEGSQPATGQPTLTTQSVSAGDYMSVAPGTENSVAQSKVGLKVKNQGGQHARLNQATGTIEAVPFFIDNDQEQFIEAKFEERPEGTALKLRLRNLHKLFQVTTSHPTLITGSFTQTTQGINLHISLTGIAGFNDLQGDPLWAWTR